LTARALIPQPSSQPMRKSPTARDGPRAQVPPWSGAYWEGIQADEIAGTRFPRRAPPWSPARPSGGRAGPRGTPKSGQGRWASLRPVFLMFGGLAGGRPVARMARQLGVITEYDKFDMAGRPPAHRSGIGRADERGVLAWPENLRRVETS
jgi:hypothetical protein